MLPLPLQNPPFFVDTIKRFAGFYFFPAKKFSENFVRSRFAFRAAKKTTKKRNKKTGQTRQIELVWVFARALKKYLPMVFGSTLAKSNFVMFRRVLIFKKLAYTFKKL
jgi:hypothetical protein